jgi:hypothetical protein
VQADGEVEKVHRIEVESLAQVGDRLERASI